MSYLFTSESVAPGHPDKLCDNISDSILDACLEIDENARVAVEAMVKGTQEESYIIVGGEITLPPGSHINYERIIRKSALSVGYDDHSLGMNAIDEERCKVKMLITNQSDEISQGVTEGEGLNEEFGAGDQGIVFGYATDESEKFKETSGSFMPMPIILAQRLTREIEKKRFEGEIDWAGPDGKSQVTVSYDEKGEPEFVDTVIIAIQHRDLVGTRFSNEKEEQDFIKEEIKEKIIKKVIPRDLISKKMKIIVNGTGRFCKGGPYADAGLTGRKIIVDSYGGMGRHGGGAFSGKDPTKVDRSGAYAARWAAKHVVASGLARKCEIQLAYSIGVAEPVSINVNVNSFGSSKYSDKKLGKIVNSIFDFRPASIIKSLKLRRPIYKVTSSGGHFGRLCGKNGEFSWEKIDESLIAKILKS